jgi:N-acetylglutamate synthase-like GNAT family acetyltransferase
MRSMKRKPADNRILRRALAEDHPQILQLLASLELEYPSRDLNHFWVYARSNRIDAIAELKEFPEFLLLSCVGVEEALQGTGIGKAFVADILSQVNQPVYLYTLIPAFFEKLGFRVTREAPGTLPPRSYYGCRNCIQQGCTCMVKTQDATGIPLF